MAYTLGKDGKTYIGVSQRWFDPNVGQISVISATRPGDNQAASMEVSEDELEAILRALDNIEVKRYYYRNMRGSINIALESNLIRVTVEGYVPITTNVRVDIPYNKEVIRRLKKSLQTVAVDRRWLG